METPKRSDEYIKLEKQHDEQITMLQTVGIDKFTAAGVPPDRRVVNIINSAKESAPDNSKIQQYIVIHALHEYGLGDLGPLTKEAAAELQEFLDKKRSMQEK